MFCRLEKANKGPMHAMKFVVFIHSCFWIEGKYPIKDYFLTFFRDLLANEWIGVSQFGFKMLCLPKHILQPVKSN